MSKRLVTKLSIVCLRYKHHVHTGLSVACIGNLFLTCTDNYRVFITLYVTGFGKTDHIVTIDISRNTDLKYRSRHGSLVLDCSHARFAV